MIEFLADVDNTPKPKDVWLDLNSLVRQLEVDVLQAALNMTQGNQAAAARLIKLERSTLIEKLNKYGIKYHGPQSDDTFEMKWNIYYTSLRDRADVLHRLIFNLRDLNVRRIGQVAGLIKAA